MRFWNSKTYWSFFLSYMVLIVTLVAIMAFASWFKFTGSYVAETQQKNEDTAYTISCSINDMLEQLMVSAQKLKKTGWVHKLYANSDIFNDYFNANRRAEIINEFVLYQAHPFVQQTALFFPEIDICISTRGWIPISRYLKGLGVTDIESQKLILEEMRNNDGFQESKEFQKYLPSNILPLTAPLERIKNSRIYICFFIDKKLLLNFLQKQASDGLISLRVWNRDSERDLLNISRFSDGELGDIQEVVYPSMIPNWSYSFVFDKSNLKIPLADFVSQIKLYSMLFLMGIVFSGILAFATYRPFANLYRWIMHQVFPNRIMKEWASIYNIIHLIKYSLEFLKQENMRMRKAEEYNSQTLRSEMIKQLLRGHFNKEEVESDIRKYGIAFTDDNYYQVLLLITNPDHNMLLDPCLAVDLYDCIKKNILSLENCCCEIVENLNNDILIVISFSNEKAAEQVDLSFVQQLARQCEAYLKYKPLISAGMPHKGFAGISISYRWAMEQRAHMLNNLEYAFYIDSLAQERCFYPLEWEVQLISSIKAGNAESVQYILDELYRKNCEGAEEESHLLPDKKKLILISSIMQTLLRVISELNLSDRIFIKDMDVILSQESFLNKWKYIEKASLEICRYVETSQIQELSANKISQDIINYVDEHFCDSDLSLKTLSEEFGVSIQTISKYFKNVVGDTFYNYLYKKRMSYACTLLENTNYTMRAIANQVGYENEYSFKRAFIRFTGVRPKDYMQNHQRNKNTEEIFEIPGQQEYTLNSIN